MLTIAVPALGISFACSTTKSIIHPRPYAQIYYPHDNRLPLRLLVTSTLVPKAMFGARRKSVWADDLTASCAPAAIERGLGKSRTDSC
jgi:hypothetical protein